MITAQRHTSAKLSRIDLKYQVAKLEKSARRCDAISEIVLLIGSVIIVWILI